MKQEELRDLLRWAILAPSTHNTQPWRFVVKDDELELHADPSRGLPVIDPSRRQLVMSCGAALFNLRVALRRFGHDAEVTPLPNKWSPSPLARVRVRGTCAPSQRDVAMFDAIPKRRTNRKPFFARPVSRGIALELSALAELEGAWLERLHPRDKLALATIVGEADRAQFASRRFRAELSRWLVPIGSRRADGIPFVKKEYGAALPAGVTFLVRTFDLGKTVASREEALAKGSPALVVLGTEHDEPADWLAAGQAMQAVLLGATTLGLSASFLNQALEREDLRARVAELAGHGPHPQLVLRLGFGPPIDRATPRRPLEDVLDDPSAPRAGETEIVIRRSSGRGS
jgi:hypothetical protein